MDTSGCVFLLLFMFFGFVTAVLQGVGEFGSDWILEIYCPTVDYRPSCCNISTNRLNCSGPFGLEDLNDDVVMIQRTAFWILIFPTMCTVVYTFCSAKDVDRDLFVCLIVCTTMLSPVAGVMSFVGCMMIVGEYPGQTYGSSFMMCLAAGLIIIIVTGIAIFVLCIILKGDKQSSRSLRDTVPRRDESIGAAAPYGEGPTDINTVAIELVNVENIDAVSGSNK